MSTVKALAAHSKGAPLEPFEFEMPELGAEEVEIAVEYCGICHSDLSMWNNDWGMTQYPFVPGHEGHGSQESQSRRPRRLGLDFRLLYGV
jgi:uncharacterized zinc-type alcohol dehydrogenase-like protein